MAVFVHGPALAQSPVRILVGFPPGGGVDAVARLLASQLEKQTGVPYLVENRTGAGGILPMRSMLSAPADGSLLVLAPDATVVVYPHTVEAPGFNPATDLMPISRVVAYDFALSVAGGSEIRNLDGLRKAALADPKASFANPAAGGMLHFYAISVANALGLVPTHVSYRGVAPATTDTIGGVVTALVTPVGPVLQLADSGRLRIIATSGAERGSKTPKVPTFKELGLPQLVMRSWFGLFAPAKTPPEVVQRLSEALRQVLADPAIQSKLAALDMDASWSNPKDFRAQIDTESRHWSSLVKASGFQVEK